MKVTLLGGGGFRTPLTFAALQRAAQRLDVHELVLHDLDAGRLGRIRRVLEALQAESTRAPFALTATTDLNEAVRGADYVLCAIRVGGLQARMVDERVPLAEGVVGQETVGPGGLCLVLRSVPVLEDIAHVVLREAPNSWFINLTNPVGVMSEVVRDVLGDRVLGVCDTPAGMCRRVAAVFGRTPTELRYDYFGLNHLGWLRSVFDGPDHDLLAALLGDDAALTELLEGQLFGQAFLRELGMLPSEYLMYYYFPERQVRAVAAGAKTRAEYLLDQERRFYGVGECAPVDALRRWRACRAEREHSYMADVRVQRTTPAHGAFSEALAMTENDGGGYAGVAISVIESLVTGVRTNAILNVANGEKLPFLARDAIVELPCTVNQSGITAGDVTDVPDHCRELMQRVHAAEQAAVIASRSASRSGAIECLALHPLVESSDLAERIFTAYLQQQPAVAERFA